MNDLTHERCSELLGAFASGELDAQHRTQVEGHLSSCRDCSLELAAIEALAAPDLVEMTGVERDRLTGAVRAALLPPRRAAWSARWGRRVAPAVGAAALLAIVALAVVSLPGDRSLPDTATGGGTTTEQVEGDEAELKGAPAPAAQEPTTETLQGGTDDSATGGAAAGKVTTNSGRLALPGSTALRAAVSTTVSEQDFATVGLDLRSLVPAKLPRRVMAYRAVEPLADSAPNERVGDLIRSCSDRAIATSLVPLVATSATYFPSDDLLVIGFVWVEGSTGDLYYEIRGWRAGRCDRVTPIYRRGVVAE